MSFHYNVVLQIQVDMYLGIYLLMFWHMWFWLLLNENLNLLLWYSNRFGVASFYSDVDCFRNILLLILYFLHILILLRDSKVKSEVSFPTQERLLRDWLKSAEIFCRLWYLIRTSLGEVFWAAEKCWPQ